MATETATMDIDIDMDIDLDLGDDFTAPEPEANNEILTDVPQEREVPAAYTDDSVPEKVHVRGLDNLATEDIRVFAAEHYPTHLPTRVEWIDDTSANIVYATTSAASAALSAFSDPTQGQVILASSTELRTAKQLSTQPQVHLQVRLATITDIKKPRARDASRFYLMNPDKDPANRPRRYDDRRAGRGRDDRPQKRRRSAEDAGPTSFDVSMYDDHVEVPARPVENGHREKRVRFGGGSGRSGDLFADRLGKSVLETSRPRSASPEGLAEGDGRYGFTEAVEEVGTSGASRYNRSAATTNGRKEVFDMESRRVLRPSSSASNKELFPNRSSPMKDANAGKELFTNGSSGHHRRSEAFDARDETNDLFSRTTGGPHMDRVSPGRPRSNGLAERIPGGPGSRDEGRPKADTGLRIRGGASVTATSVDNPGFTIKGVAKGLNPKVKELFPQKTGGDKEKDLFAEKMKGKMAPRRRAEDLFGV